MRRTALCIFGAALCVSSACAQEEESQPEPRKIPPVVAEMQQPVRVAQTPVLAGGTQVWLRLAGEVKVKKVKVGDQVDFVLYRDLYYRHWLLAKAGTPVQASIQKVDRAKVANRGSDIVIIFHGLKLLNEQILPLTGETRVKGGAGTGGHIAGGIMDVAAHCFDWPCLLFDIPAIPAAALIGVASKGENRDIKVDTSAPAYTDGDFEIDLQSLQTLEQPVGTPGKVIVLRGVYGWPYSRDLYCNGVPLAHLNSKHYLELALAPGYYRFSINPKNGSMQIFVNAGSETKLITDYEHVYELNERDVSINTGKSLGKRNAGQLLKEAKPIEKPDLFGTGCAPLSEEKNPPS